MKTRRAALTAAFALPLASWLGGCAVLFPSDPPQVSLVGLEPLAGQGLEVRMLAKLRITNPSDSAIDYDGLALELEVQGKSFASGVSNVQGTVPRYGEAVLAVPVTISAIAVLRQAAALSQGTPDKLLFVLSGKLAGGAFSTVRFRSEGEFRLPDGLER